MFVKLSCWLAFSGYCGFLVISFASCGVFKVGCDFDGFTMCLVMLNCLRFDVCSLNCGCLGLLFCVYFGGASWLLAPWFVSLLYCLLCVWVLCYFICCLWLTL